MICFFIIIILCGSPAFGSPDENRLLQKLLFSKNHTYIERPVEDHNKAVVVVVTPIIQQILHVDEKNQLIQLVIWLQQTWKDYSLVWNPDDYGGIKVISVPSPSNTIWRPDVLLFNSVEEKFDTGYPVNIVVSYDGEILYCPPGIVKSSCAIDITWFPFDEQVCMLKYGSWTFPEKYLDLQLDYSINEGKNLTDPHRDLMDTSYYIPNGEWDLIATPAYRKEKPFLNETYLELKYYLHLRRKTKYYGLNWVVPSVLISLSNVLGFTLPPESGEKITLQITNLLSVTVFLGMVNDVTPPTSDSIPVITAFFSVSMLNLGCSVFATVLVINFHYRSPRTHHMSPWMRGMFLEWLPWVLLMKRPGQNFRRPLKSSATQESFLSSSQPMSKYKSESVLRMVKMDSDTSLRQHKSTDQLLNAEQTQYTSAQLNGSIRGSPIIPFTVAPQVEPKKTEATLEAAICRIENVLAQVTDFLRIMRSRLEEEDEEEAAKDDWQFVARVVDRVCIFIFSATLLAAVAFLTASASRLYFGGRIANYTELGHAVEISG